MSPSEFSSTAARQVAARLIDCGCVNVRTDEPFRLPSGWASPVYMDCRRLLSFPAVRREIVAASIESLNKSGVLVGIASVAGGEASGIAFAAWIADALDLSMIYARKRAAGRNQVEGVVRLGDTVLLVDDLMAAGHSKVRFCEALTAAGARVKDVFVIFDYATFDAHALLATLDCRVLALACWRDVLAVSRDRGDFTPAALDELQRFLDDPRAWSEAHGGISHAEMLHPAN